MCGEWENYYRGYVDLYIFRFIIWRLVILCFIIFVFQLIRVKFISIILFLVYGKYYYIFGYVDFWQRGGEISFCFWILFFIGFLLIILRIIFLFYFMSFEVFDGKLYFVYDFGVLM